MTHRIMNGNELVIQGGLEAGFSLYTGYPGSPLADFFNILHAQRQELARRGIRVAIANSEANAAAMAGGSKQAGRNCLVAMKSMGLHVAADSLSVGNFANPGQPFRDPETGQMCRPGVVVVVGDDPWSMSTSTPADSRYLFKHLHMPFLEPASPQEVKDWVRHALAVSQRSSVYCGLLLTTFLAEGGGRVEVGGWARVPEGPERINPAEFDLGEAVMVPPNSLAADTRMVRERFPRVRQALEALDLDRLHGNTDARIGFIASGAAFATLHQVMHEAGLLERFSLFKPACSYPLAGRRLLPWLQGLDTLIVVEEKRGFLETELTAFCHEHGIAVRIMGKQFIAGERLPDGFPAHGGLSYEIMQRKLAELLPLLGHPSCTALAGRPTSRPDGTLPQRLPTFCPGCPHRETLSLLKELRRTLEREGVELIAHGDVGCYSLSFLPPFGEMHNIGAMGQGGAVGAGLDSFSRNPSVVLVGDSTFFHSGMNTISSSVQMNHDITYIVLDNDVTAMTGHQMTPSTGCSVEGQTRPRQDILAVVRGLGVSNAIEVNPSDRYFYRNVLAGFIRKPGTKVIVSSKECGLTYHGRQRARDRALFRDGGTKPMQAFFRVSTSACEDCRACVEATGCPGLSRTEDAYGPKVDIDPQICVADGYCSRIMACPSFEQVQVFDFHPTRYRSLPRHGGTTIPPEPQRRKTFDDILAGNDWRVVVTGVGGSGVTTISRVLAEAARDMDGLDGVDFGFMDQKGLAQRNGRVTGHLALHRSDRPAGPITPEGTADLVISPDLLDGSQAIGFLAPHGLALLEESFQVPLSMMLDRGEDAPPITARALRTMLEDKLGQRARFAPGRELSDQVLGRGVYASALLLGAAFQLGSLPFSTESLHQAFCRAAPKAELEANWQAFSLGRRLIHEGRDAVMARRMQFVDEAQEALLRRSVADSLLPWQRSGPLLQRFDQALEQLVARFPEISREHHARYVHDLLVYDRGARLSALLDDAARLVDRYTSTEHRRIALRALVKTYLIKDEILVAHLLVSPLERKRMEQQYGDLGTRFRVSRTNRPSFPLFGREIAFDIRTRDWMLRLVRHLRLIRRLVPAWHRRERALAERIRSALLETVPSLPADQARRWLMRLDNIKGYREVRLEKGESTLAELDAQPSRTLAIRHVRREPAGGRRLASG